eukprot:TRINITY_DN12104_c0_g1_i1.p1 TRINITY_DN12104_c0_g1~~TRINITY_DN12104_c0_g1_i1.p1  ORF type:complete len:330 (-),score=79.00 TRINITY_DN12104_c0_g1_i1:83-1072(-)
MRTFILLFVLAYVACALREETSYQIMWENFKLRFNRKYESDSQHYFRYDVFKSNVDLIDQLNAKYNPTTVFGINHFADMTREEYISYVRQGAKKGFSNVQSAEQQKLAYHTMVPPTSVDWRTKGAVTPITNQDQCGSSPYFGATCSMEGAWAIAGNKLEVLSVQQIMDCSGNYGNQACNGGWMNSSIQYVIDAGGIESNTSYPYTGEDGNTCNFNKNKVVAKFRSLVNIDSTDEAMVAALTICPVATAVNAYATGFQYYQSGVYMGADCDANQPDHGIGVVGYGVYSNGLPYYILKNTWTTAWGMDGYMYLYRFNNTCGIVTEASYAVV